MNPTPMLSDEYIFQEIQEQKRILAFHSALAPPPWPSCRGNIIITGSGDSYCASLFGAWVLAEQARVVGLPALEASRAARTLTPEDIIICISVSGRTVRVLEAAKRALQAGAQVVAVTDSVDSPLAQSASLIWPIHASPTEKLRQTEYQDQLARQYVGYHHDVAQTKTFWAVLLTLARAAQAEVDWETLASHSDKLLDPSFYEHLVGMANFWAESGQLFFLGSGWVKTLARFAAYKMFEFNRTAHHTGIEEYCHTHYFITRTEDTVVFLIDGKETAARAAEIVPVLYELFTARMILLLPHPMCQDALPANVGKYAEIIYVPEAIKPAQQFLVFVLALEWLTYAIGRVDAPNINTFHAGYDTERLVAGTLRTIRRSVVKV